jgi:hypothetical protein
MGDHGRFTLGHVAAKKSRGYYCPPENPDEFGTHSYRIGGATALFAAGANETVGGDAPRRDRPKQRRGG